MKRSILFLTVAKSFIFGALFVSFTTFSQEPDTLQFYFATNEYNSFTMSNEDKSRLKNLYKETRILAILGHCDYRGPEEYNHNLSRQRMEHVRRQLKNSGFDVSKSRNEALGESEASSSGLSLEKCRRVDVLYIPAVIKTEPIVLKEEVRDKPLEEIEPPAMVGLSKSAIEAFLEDDTAEELQFDLTILFVNVSTRVLEESKPQLFELLEIMQNNPNLNATFHGHVCCQPHYEISEGRARTVAIFLRENGIDADRIDYMGHSNTQPKVWPEVTDEDRKLNRRVAVEFSKIEE